MLCTWSAQSLQSLHTHLVPVSPQAPKSGQHQRTLGVSVAVAVRAPQVVEPNGRVLLVPSHATGVATLLPICASGEGVFKKALEAGSLWGGAVNKDLKKRGHDRVPGCAREEERVSKTERER